MSPSPYLRALVTSSLTRSSVVSTRGSRSQLSSWPRAYSRARPTLRGSRGSVQSPTESAEQALDTCHQQRDVVLAVVGVEGVEDVVADVLQGAEGSVSAPTNAWRPSSRG